MQKAKLSWLFIINIFLLVTAVITLAKPNLVQSATAGHVVISEVQAGLTGDGGNEFIELYNPTGSSVNISGWKLTKKTASADPATEQVLFATVPSSTSIASHGYYLIAHTDFIGAVTEDLTYNSDPISTNNTIYLKNSSDVIVDKLGLGTTNDFEGTAKGNPPATGSVERKANSSSTNSSMIAGGADVLLGNGEDTDNNSADFVNRNASDPQNAASATENPSASPAPSATASATPTPSASPSASASATPAPSASASASPSVAPSTSPSATPTSTPSMSPSASPSATPTPSASPSQSPSASPSASASPSMSPSASPSVKPSASPSASVNPSPSASASASVSPSQTPKPSSTPKPRKTLVCKFEPQTLKFGRIEFTFHVFSCDWIVK